MSLSAAGAWDADVATAFRDARLNRVFNLAPFALLYYDYLLTLPAEIERYWTADLSPKRGTLWFLVCRCSGLWKIIICPALIAYHQFYILVSQVLVAIMLNIRTYALYERSRRIFYLLWTVSVAVLAVCCYGLVRHHEPTPEEPAAIGCNVATSSSSGRNLAITWGAMLCHDTMIFTLTLCKALSLRGGPRGIVDLILRDGTMYFGLIMCFTSTTVFTFLFSRPVLKGFTATFTNILSTMLIARLMLNIRDPKLLHPNSHSRLRTATDFSDDLIVTSALETGRPDWSERGYEQELYETESAVHGSRNDVIELVRRDHPPPNLRGKISWRTETSGSTGAILA
ncbi:hypothetical protein PsYK624_026820 [Phanerochaete sordida]|uniref:DUF6533 domain-containing protein n=1 Tax=Phanerochaete sordida TaxID=48140 RepID=A0A9P3G0B1_9APHY|nr:hypothetical protein PsYK624_026820 [Phanerochaete sordida]